MYLGTRKMMQPEGEKNLVATETQQPLDRDQTKVDTDDAGAGRNPQVQSEGWHSVDSKDTAETQTPTEHCTERDAAAAATPSPLTMEFIGEGNELQIMQKRGKSAFSHV